MGVDIVVSDFGGVLTTPLEASFRFWAQRSGVSLEQLGVAMGTATERAGGIHPLFALERGEKTQEAFFAALEEPLRETLGRDVSMATFADEYFSHLAPNEAMLAALAGWRDRGVRLAMLTNNVREWEASWRAILAAGGHPIDELFETVVDSAFVGFRKPEPEIYAIVLSRLGDVDPARCVLVDDLDVNCVAARGLGWSAVQFVSTEQAVAEVEALLQRPVARSWRSSTM